MILQEDIFAGFLNGWLLGLEVIDFVMPLGIVVWLLLLYLLPLSGLKRTHNLGGLTFSIFFAAMGSMICLGAPIIGGLDYPFEVDFVVCTFLIFLSLYRWNKSIYFKFIMKKAKIGGRDGQ